MIPSRPIDLGVGVGLREPHYPSFLTGDHRPAAWVEVNAEKYLRLDGDRFDGHLQVLEAVRRDLPVVLHGTSMNLGAVAVDNRDYLRRLRELCAIIEPAMVSDHLCWTGTGGTHLFDLLPLPFTEAAIDVVVERIGRAQDALGRPILVENLSSYVELAGAELSEWEFVREVVTRADCGLLLDLNNVHVSGHNHGWDPHAYLEALPHERVHQLHLAGHERRGDLLVDTHGAPIADEVWSLYAWYTERYGAVSVMIERDNHVPPWSVLAEELTRLAGLRASLAGTLEGGLRRCA